MVDTRSGLSTFAPKVGEDMDLGVAAAPIAQPTDSTCIGWVSRGGGRFWRLYPWELEDGVKPTLILLPLHAPSGDRRPQLFGGQHAFMEWPAPYLSTL